MKVLILSLYNDNFIYNKMLEVQRSYIHNNNNFDVFFILFDNNISEDIKIINDIIYIKGKESYINILLKTLNSLNYITNTLQNKYDYIVRTNISTILHLDNLYYYLSKLPKTEIYIGGNIEELKWQLQPYELIDNKHHLMNAYYGLKYVQGIGIILSFDVVKKLLELRNSIEYDIVDDVKLGLIIRDFIPNVYNNLFNLPLANVTYNDITSESVFIRNRTNNRLTDIINMRNIINNLYNIQYPNYNKTIYITYKNIDKLVSIKQQWLDLNPDYNVELYDDQGCLSFLETHYGKKYCDIFNYIKDGAIKSDFFRVCVLYIYGGIYVDADIKPLVPLKQYIDDDVNFAICLSYNFKRYSSGIYNYNPHFIVTKRFNKYLYNTIKQYEELFDKKNPYSYWEWSICVLLNINFNFEIKHENNKVIYDEKKYQFLIETVIKDDYIYNFTNSLDENNKLKFTYYDKCFCTYENKIVLENFTNKYLLD